MKTIIINKKLHATPVFAQSKAWAAIASGNSDYHHAFVSELA